MLSGAMLAATCAGGAELERSGVGSETPSRVVFLRQQSESQILFRDLLDRQALNPHADHLGRVHDVVVDHDGRIVGILLSVGGFFGLGDKLVGVSWNDVTIRFDGKFVVVNLTREELYQAPEYLPWQQVRHRPDGRVLVDSRESSGASQGSLRTDAVDARHPPAARQSLVDSNARRPR